LIKGISASLDSNYFVSDKNKFVGPTMLHAALVAEPFIKGLKSFIPLSDEHENRQIIQLEDKQPDFYSILEMIKETLNSIKENSLTKEEFKELLKREQEEKTEEEVEEKPDEVEEKKKADEEKKEGDKCKLPDGEEGQYKKDEDGKLVCKPHSKENKDDEEEELKKKYEKCVSDKVKDGTDLGEAIKDCQEKFKLERQTSEEDSEDKSETESEDETKDAPEKVDLSDAEGIYERYLKVGKIVPAQKEAFIQLLASGKILNLGDKQVDFSKLIESFMKSQPKVVNFEENGTAGGEPTEKEEKETEIPEEVKQFYTNMGLSDDAIKESYEYAKKLQEDEKKEKESTIFN